MGFRRWDFSLPRLLLCRRLSPATLGTADSQRETSLRQKRLSTVLCLALPFPSPKVMEGKKPDSASRGKEKTHHKGVFSFSMVEHVVRKTTFFYLVKIILYHKKRLCISSIFNQLIYSDGGYRIIAISEEAHTGGSQNIVAYHISGLPLDRAFGYNFHIFISNGYFPLLR